SFFRSFLLITLPLLSQEEKAQVLAAFSVSGISCACFPSFWVHSSVGGTSTLNSGGRTARKPHQLARRPRSHREHTQPHVLDPVHAARLISHRTLPHTPRLTIA